MNKRELLDELKGNVCRCGKPKKPRQTFCRSCYYSLSPALRKSLYNRIGQGYEEAYAAAARELGFEDAAERTAQPGAGGLA